MRSLILLLTLLSVPAQAKDSRPVYRLMYAKLWTPVILKMFADAGPTRVVLAKSTLVITNPHCNEPAVKTILAETFAPARAKMKEIGLKVQCVDNAVAAR